MYDLNIDKINEKEKMRKAIIKPSDLIANQISILTQFHIEMRLK